MFLLLHPPLDRWPMIDFMNYVRSVVVGVGCGCADLIILENDIANDSDGDVNVAGDSDVDDDVTVPSPLQPHTRTPLAMPLTIVHECRG